MYDNVRIEKHDIVIGNYCNKYCMNVNINYCINICRECD